MFEKILATLGGLGRHETPMPDADADHAFGALLVRIAKSDSNYQVQELQRIDALLADRMQLNPVEAAMYRAECEKLEKSMPHTAELGKILTENVPIVEREAMFASLWDVLMADGVRHTDEVVVINQVADIFGISQSRAQELTQN